MSIRWRPGVCVCVCVFVCVCVCVCVCVLCVCVCFCVGLSKCLVCEQLGYLYAGFRTRGALCWSYGCVTPMSRESLDGQGLLIEASLSHSVTPYSVGLLRTSDQPDGETSTWQQISMSNGGIRTRHPSKRAATDPSCDRKIYMYYIYKILSLSWAKEFAWGVWLTKD